jgi:predicted nucleic acid-binding protein
VILADTSLWIDHLRASDTRLAALLDAGRILIHPFVIGEIALGNLRQRSVVLGALAGLPQTAVAQDNEVLTFIENLSLFGRGIGYVDAHLLAAVRLTPGATLWTKDIRLHQLAAELGLAMTP